MQVPSYFTDFMTEIRLTPNQTSNAQTGHIVLRDRLSAWDDLKPYVVATFLQGSYVRKTAVRPKGEGRADVDVIVVTKVDAENTPPQEAIELFVPFVENYYKGKYTITGRAIKIELSYVELDLVVTAAPSEVETADMAKVLEAGSTYDEDILVKSLPQAFIKLAQQKEWRLEPLLIPDRDAHQWKRTHPLEQIKWTIEKNANCNGHYVNVVKAVKWWRLINEPKYKHPKGYPLEHIVGVNCPDGISSIADGFTRTLESVRDTYGDYVDLGRVPSLADHGVPEHNVLAHTEPDEFAAFYDEVCVAAPIAREALDETSLAKSVELWRQLFGSKFPSAPADSGGAPGAYTERTRESDVRDSRWA